MSGYPVANNLVIKRQWTCSSKMITLHRRRNFEREHLYFLQSRHDLIFFFWRRRDWWILQETCWMLFRWHDLISPHGVFPHFTSYANSFIFFFFTSGWELYKIVAGVLYRDASFWLFWLAILNLDFKEMSRTISLSASGVAHFLNW
jgi:hypothetical protein